MHLQEEYFKRRNVKAPLFKFSNGILFLKSKDPNGGSLFVSISENPDQHNPGRFLFVVSASAHSFVNDPYGNIHGKKNIVEENIFWEGFENRLLSFTEEYSKTHRAVVSSEAISVLWHNYLIGIDTWLATYLTNEMTDILELTLIEEDIAKQIQHIKKIEDWLKEKFESIWQSWRQVKKTVDSSSYADWLAHIVNGTANA